MISMSPTTSTIQLSSVHNEYTSVAHYGTYVISTPSHEPSIAAWDSVHMYNNGNCVCVCVCVCVYNSGNCVCTANHNVSGLYFGYYSVAQCSMYTNNNTPDLLCFYYYY